MGVFAQSGWLGEVGQGWPTKGRPPERLGLDTRAANRKIGQAHPPLLGKHRLQPIFQYQIQCKRCNEYNQQYPH